MTFKRFLACFILCLLCALPLIGCGKAKISAPKSSDAVIGNGSFAVTKGDYLYFTNGFMPIGELTTKNKNNKFVKGALYVTKLNSNGHLQVNEDGVLSNYEIITTKLTGYENSELYIFGEYLYFVSPNTDKSVSGELDTSISIVYRIKLDKSSDIQKVASTKGENSEYQLEFYHKDNVTYLLIFEDSKLYRVKCDKKIGKKTLVASDISSVAMPAAANYPEQANLHDKIYFTTSMTEDETEEFKSGNKLCGYNIATNKISDALKIGDYTYSVIEVKNGFLYFTQTNTTFTVPYLRRVELDKISTVVTPAEIGHIQYGTYLFFENNFDGGDAILGINDKVVHLIRANDDIPQVILSDGFEEILFIDGSKIYYRTSTHIARFDIKPLSGAQQNSNVVDLSEIDILTKDENADILVSVDSDSRFLYCYVQLTNHIGDDKTENKSYYMHRLDMTENDAATFQFCGVYAKIDTPDEPEE